MSNVVSHGLVQLMNDSSEIIIPISKIRDFKPKHKEDFDNRNQLRIQLNKKSKECVAGIVLLLGGK